MLDSEPPSSVALSCESREKEAEERAESATPSPHMNVIVKEEEEEELLYGTETTVPLLFHLFSNKSMFCCIAVGAIIP